MFERFLAFLPQQLHKGVNGHDAEVVSSPGPDIDGLLAGFLIADDQSVQDFFHLGFPHLVAEFFIPQVHLHAHASLLQRVPALPGKILLNVRHGQNPSLYRSEPCRKRSGEVFCEDADELFH